MLGLWEVRPLWPVLFRGEEPVPDLGESCGCRGGGGGQPLGEHLGSGARCWLLLLDIGGRLFNRGEVFYFIAKPPNQLLGAVADNAGLRLIGAVLAIFRDSGGVQSGQMVYIGLGVNELFLSKSASHDLGLVSEDFLMVQSWRRKVRFVDQGPAPPPLTCPRGGNLGGPAMSQTRCLRYKLTLFQLHVLGPFGSFCFGPPFPPTVENARKLRDWLLDQNAASSFNTRPYQPILMMQGAKPLSFMVS